MTLKKHSTNLPALMIPDDLEFSSQEVQDSFVNINSLDTEVTVNFTNTCANLIFPAPHSRIDKVIPSGDSVSLTLLVRDLQELDKLVEKDSASLAQSEKLATQTRKLIAQERPRDKDYEAAAFYVTSPEKKFTELTSESPKPIRGKLRVVSVGSVRETAQNMVTTQNQMTQLLATMASLLANQQTQANSKK